MLMPSVVFAAFEQADISLHAGVPDSLLKDYIAYVGDHTTPHGHVITANEGGAVALAAGHYLATGRPAVVYLQNSGLGNALNPLMSLAHQTVFGIPMVLLIGWRGEPGRPDEPQHISQGIATAPMLEAASVLCTLLPPDEPEATRVISSAVARSVRESRPEALLVRSGTFSPYRSTAPAPAGALLTREEAIGLVADAVEPDGVIIATTGKTSRELYEYRIGTSSQHQTDFLTVGSMGHASQIALGISIAQPERPVWVLDGDGALVMHLGGMATIGEHAPLCFRHIVLNNRAHDSVGGQPTPTTRLEIPEIALAAGYRRAGTADGTSEVLKALATLKSDPGPGLVEIKVQPGSRNDLGRPSSTPGENKERFKEFLAP